jgi:CRP-like cAMP-binding protein
VADLFTGKIFGELALVNRSPRMGTIVATRNSHLAIMNKEEFDKIFSG